jgi:hypothetical protein
MVLFLFCWCTLTCQDDFSIDSPLAVLGENLLPTALSTEIVVVNGRHVPLRPSYHHWNYTRRRGISYRLLPPATYTVPELGLVLDAVRRTTVYCIGISSNRMVSSGACVRCRKREKSARHKECSVERLILAGAKCVCVHC